VARDRERETSLTLPQMHTRDHGREPPPSTPSLGEIAREWGRIGCLGFGGPPVHIALFRELCVERRPWLTSAQFERAIAATNLLPGPASTQLSIYCAWRLQGARGALLGGVCFIAPGLVTIIALAALFLAGSPPVWLRGAGMGAGAAVAAVAVRAGLDLAGPIWADARAGHRRVRVFAYGLAGGAAAALAGPGLVLVLLGCGGFELAHRRLARRRTSLQAWLGPATARLARLGTHAQGRRGDALSVLAATVEPGGTLALMWTALKVGALAFGGGFVIVPLMQADAVGTYHWMTHAQFLDAVALGQVTPGPLVQTIAVVGYAAAGLPGALLAAVVAFAPSFSFILLGAGRFERLLANERALAFLAGAAPGAAGAIIGAAIPLTGALTESWQYAVLACAAVALLALRRSIVVTLLAAGCVGAIAALLGAPITR
jgi:chromate transporter